MLKLLSPYIVQSCTIKGITCLLPLSLLLILCTSNKTANSNKMVILSSIALYYGDTYIVPFQVHYNWSHQS